MPDEFGEEVGRGPEPADADRVMLKIDFVWVWDFLTAAFERHLEE
jgi:hypothetical protein